jgi:hypothetical protein
MDGKHTALRRNARAKVVRTGSSRAFCLLKKQGPIDPIDPLNRSAIDPDDPIDPESACSTG